MAITFISSGAIVDGLNTNITPVVGGAYSIGDALIYSTGEQFGSGSQTAPAGWTQLSPNSTVTAVTIWGRIATTTSETIPSVNWGAANRGWAHLTVFRGVDSAFTSTMTGTAERGSNTTADIVNSAGAHTPTQDGSLAFWAGGRNKTVTTDGTVYTPPANWTIAVQNARNGTSYSAAIAYWIQATASSVPANAALTGSLTEGTAQAMRSTMIFLAPAASSGGGGGGTGTVSFPPPKRKTYIIYDQYYPR